MDRESLLKLKIIIILHLPGRIESGHLREMNLLGWETDIFGTDSHCNDVWLFYSEQELQRDDFSTWWRDSMRMYQQG